MSDKQEFLDFTIISFILMSFMFELAVILLVGIRCVSLSGVKGLKDTLVTLFPFLAEFPVSFHSMYGRDYRLFSVTLHCVNCEITFVLILCMSTFHRSEQLHIVETLLHILQMVSTVEQGVQGLGG